MVMNLSTTATAIVLAGLQNRRGPPRSEEPDSNETLRLRLALKEAEIRAWREAIEIEKERMQLRGAAGNNACNLPVVDNIVVNNDLYNRSTSGLRLPMMSDGDEIVGFFHSFEKACTLNGVTRSRISACGVGCCLRA